jgi:hypothetical protein
MKRWFLILVDRKHEFVICDQSELKRVVSARRKWALTIFSTLQTAMDDHLAWVGHIRWVDAWRWWRLRSISAQAHMDYTIFGNGSYRRKVLPPQYNYTSCSSALLNYNAINLIRTSRWEEIAVIGSVCRYGARVSIENFFRLISSDQDKYGIFQTLCVGMLVSWTAIVAPNERPMMPTWLVVNGSDVSQSIASYRNNCFRSTILWLYDKVV